MPWEAHLVSIRSTRKYKLKKGAEKISKVVLLRWTSLRGISNSSAAKSTIVIPLLGYWIIFNETIAGWLRLISPLSDGGPHVSYRLLWTYIALSCIAFGTFLYAIFCPPEVKKYADYQDYINGDGEAMTKSTIETMLAYLESKGHYELREGVAGMARAEADGDIMDIYFQDANEQAPAARLTVTLLYYLGFGILGILSIQVLGRVVVMALGPWVAN